jgi:signal transduction histidine kinase
MSLRVNTSTSWSHDDDRIAALRIVLAASALLIIYIDPAEPNRYVALTYTSLVCYALYSVTLYALARRRSPLLPSIRAVSHWVDVGWYTLLIALSNGTHSVFFFGFYFAILVASFRWGFTSGIRVTLVSAIIFSTVGLLAASPEPHFELNRFLLRPTYLLVLGFMMAHRGGFEIALKRRLALLNDITTLANLRVGVDHTIGSVMEQLRVFYDADACLLVEDDQESAVHRLRRATRDYPEAAIRAETIPEGWADILEGLPSELAAVYSGWRGRRVHGHSFDVVTGRHLTGPPPLSERLAALLDCQSFVTVPLRSQRGTVNRLYLISQRRHAFTAADVDFLLQVSTHLMPILDNIRLVDRLASGAAEEERHRIARDLHDSVIQPYLGLHLGLAALRRQLLAGGTEVKETLERLIALTDGGAADLRRYVRGLKDGSGREGDLLQAVRRFGAKFTEATGITVHVAAETEIHVSERLAVEAFQMVAEGLSNVRRHTDATQATVGLACRNRQLTLCIENAGEEQWAPFTPRSLAERATALGGQARVERRADNGSIVVVEIPL